MGQFQEIVFLQMELNHTELPFQEIKEQAHL